MRVMNCILLSVFIGWCINFQGIFNNTYDCAIYTITVFVVANG